MKKAIYIAVTVLIVTILGGCGKTAENEPGKIVYGDSSEGQAIEAYGTIKAYEVRNIEIDFPAYVEKISVKNGQKVKKGEELMTLNIDSFKAEIKEKESEISSLKEQDKGLDSQKERIKALEDSLTVLKKRLEQGNVNENHILCDVENGLVYDLGFDIGDIITSGKKLMTIANMDNIKVWANVNQEFISGVGTGAEVDIIPEYNKNIKYQGKVSFIATKALQNNGETIIPVEITFSDKAEGLILDSDVQVKIYPVKSK